MYRKCHSYLTTTQVARSIGVAPSTICKWHRKGHIKGHRLPGSRGERRFLIQDVIDFCRDRNLPFHINGVTEPVIVGNVVAATDDSRLLSFFEDVKNAKLYPAQCATDVGLLAARVQPILILLDRQIVSRWEAIQAVASLRRHWSALAFVLILNEDEQREDYPGDDGIILVGRPFGVAELSAVIPAFFLPSQITNSAYVSQSG